MRARERPGMPSIWQGPSPRNVLSDARLGTSLDSRLGHRDSRSRRLVHPRGALAGLPEARSPSTRPVANGRHASLDPGVACRLLQPDTTRGHTLTSVRPSHASGAFAPLLAGTNRCRLRWPCRCVAASMACEPRSVHSDLRAPCSTCVDGTDCGPRRSSKGDRAFLDEFARALLVTPRAPGSPARLGKRPGGPHPSSVRPRSPSDASPRRETPSKRPGCLLPYRNPYVTGGWLLRARLDRGPFTPPPWRHCSGTVAPFAPPRVRLPI
jgi:hypothetical protein